MKFKFSLFVWLSSVIAALIFITLGWSSYKYAAVYARPLTDPKLSADEQAAALLGIQSGLKVLGVALLLGTSLLFLWGKKLRRRTFAGIFAVLAGISLLAASLTAVYYGHY